jgi:hypothetical protein
MFAAIFRITLTLYEKQVRDDDVNTSQCSVLRVENYDGKTKRMKKVFSFVIISER